RRERARASDISAMNQREHPRYTSYARRIPALRSGSTTAGRWPRQRPAQGGTTMRRWILVGVLCLSAAVPGAVFSATAAASSAPTPHRCDGDHDRDDVGCPPTRARVRVAPMPRPVVVMPRVTG